MLNARAVAEEIEALGTVRELRPAAVRDTCSGSLFLSGVYADTGKRCFLKYYRPGRTDEAQAEMDFSQRFHRTAEQLGVTHADAVRVHSLIRLSDGAAMLVMDFAEGALVLNLIRAGKRLDAERSQALRQGFAEMARVMAAADMVHCDVCPKNLMLDGDKLVLFDFQTAMDRECPVMRDPLLGFVRSQFGLGAGYTRTRGDWNDLYALLCTYEDLRPVLTVPDFAGDIRRLHDLACAAPTYRACYTVSEAWKQRMRPQIRRMALRPAWASRSKSREKIACTLRMLKRLLAEPAGTVVPGGPTPGTEPPADGVFRLVLWRAGTRVSEEVRRAEAALSAACADRDIALTVAEGASVRTVNVSSPDAVIVMGLSSLERLMSWEMPDAPMAVCCLPGDLRRLRFRGRRCLAKLRRLCRLPRLITVPSEADLPFLRAKLGWEGVMPEVLPQTAVPASFGELPGLCRACAASVPALSALGLLRTFADGSMDFLGHGARRICRRVPGEPYVVKFYRQPCELSETAPREVQRELAQERNNEWRNTCCEESDYFHKVILKCPDEVRAAFPDRVEKIYLPGHGWGILESLVLNEDGSLPVKIADWLRGPEADDAGRRAAAEALKTVYFGFYRHAIRFFDLQNLFLQFAKDGSFRIRLTDFEPRSRTLIPLDRLCKQLVRNKFRRRFRRFAAALRDVLPEASAFAEER